MTANPPQVEEILAQAVEIGSADERQAYIDRACADQPQLQLEVERLVALHFQAGSFLESPPAPFAGPATLDQPPERPGTQIGPYKLLEQIGEGGFGVVYMAEQTEPVRRKVALKVLKPGMDSRQIVARFEAERQALALMDHPNIARVFDGGTTPSGRPYFVMELVKGAPITDYCDQHRLTPRQRLELFVAVCQAVQHAHQKGVIHRDIKPTNVLVTLHDTEPVVKVIDFGVAKALGQELTDRTLFTGFAQMLGTPLYMSPEQAGQSDLDIDTRSDIYSLGVLLYELLTGTTPFDKSRFQQAAYDEIRRIIREEEPPKPSTRLSSVGSAHGPSRSHRPHRTGTANPPRHAVPAEPSGPTLASIAAVRNTEPAKLTKLIRGELDWIVMKALEKDRSRRYETANTFAADVQRYLNDEQVQACPPSATYRFRKFARRNKVGLLMAALVFFFLILLGSAIGWVVRDKSAREMEAARQQANRHAKAAGQVELIFAEVERLEKRQQWTEALAVARRAEAILTGGEADAVTQRRVHKRLKDLAFLDRLEQIRMQWRSPNEGPSRKFALAFREYGVDIEAYTVEESIELLKARPTIRIPVAAALDAWVFILRYSRMDAARTRRLVAIARGIDPEPVRDRLRSCLGRPIAQTKEELSRLADTIDVRAHNRETLYLLGHTLRDAGLKDSALRIFVEAQAVYPDDYWLNNGLGYSLYYDKQDFEGGIRYFTVAASLRPDSDFNTLLGFALEEQGRFDEAVALYRRYIERDTEHHVGYFYHLGRVLHRQGKLEEAAASYQRYIELDTSGKIHFGYRGLGDVLRAQGKFDESMTAYHKAIEVAPNKLSVGHCYVHLGDALRAERMLDDAVSAYHKAIEVDPMLTAEAYLRIGKVQIRQNKSAEALAALSKAIELDQKNADAATINDLAWLLVTCSDTQFRDPAQAIRLAKKAVELDPTNGYYANTLGVAHYRASNWKDAVTALEKSMDLRNGGDSIDWFFLGMAHWQLGQKEKARQWYDRAVQWMDKNEPNSEELRPIRAEAEDLLKKLD